MPARPINLLFLCTGNSARSILSEAIVNRLGGGDFHAFSAGSRPVGVVNPGALELLNRLDYPTEGLRSKSWDEFAEPDSPVMDHVVTVCKRAAGETCPIWPGSPVSEHWDIDDPADVGGSEDDTREAFESAYRTLEFRITRFLERIRQGDET